MKICRKCGRSEAYHHEPDWIETPPGCVCNPLDWKRDRPIPPVCSEFVGTFKTCDRCDHEKECHQ